MALQDVLRELRTRIRETDPAALAEPGDALVLDVREGDEWQAGYVPGAKHVPRGLLEMRVEQLEPDRDRRILVYCAGGNRSLLAAESLGRLGYGSVESVAGGFTRWKAEGRPVAVPHAFTDADRRRYARHVVIPEVGEEGQARLLASRVLLVGAGGLGSPAALYLAAAGIGTLTVVDDDVVDETNLQRQVLHDTLHLGVAKVDSARERLLALNPGIRVVGIRERLDAGNVERLLAGQDVVLDGCDNFSTRYLVNDACARLGIPDVHGSVHRFEGQVTVFSPPEGPCYRCLFPEPPPPELAPNCAEAGVLGVLPGVIGLLQAVEVVKLVLGLGAPLVGRMLAYDALEATLTELRLRRDPGCRGCGEGARRESYSVVGDACASGAAEPAR